MPVWLGVLPSPPCFALACRAGTACLRPPGAVSGPRDQNVGRHGMLYLKSFYFPFPFSFIADVLLWSQLVTMGDWETVS